MITYLVPPSTYITNTRHSCPPILPTRTGREARGWCGAVQHPSQQEEIVVEGCAWVVDLVDRDGHGARLVRARDAARAEGELGLREEAQLLDGAALGANCLEARGAALPARRQQRVRAAQALQAYAAMRVALIVMTTATVTRGQGRHGLGLAQQPHELLHLRAVEVGGHGHERLGGRDHAHARSHVAQRVEHPAHEHVV